MQKDPIPRIFNLSEYIDALHLYRSYTGSLLNYTEKGIVMPEKIDIILSIRVRNGANVILTSDRLPYDLGCSLILQGGKFLESFDQSFSSLKISRESFGMLRTIAPYPWRPTVCRKRLLDVSSYLEQPRKATRLDIMVKGVRIYKQPEVINIQLHRVLAHGQGYTVDGAGRIYQGRIPTRDYLGISGRVTNEFDETVKIMTKDNIPIVGGTVRKFTGPTTNSPLVTYIGEKN